jgi:hypothetical protein
VTRVGIGIGIGIDSFPAVHAMFDCHPVDAEARIDKAHAAVFDSDSDPDPTTAEPVKDFG